MTHQTGVLTSDPVQLKTDDFSHDLGLLPRFKPQLDSFGVRIVAEAAVGLGFATARHGNAGRAFFSVGETASNVNSRVMPPGP